MIRFAAIVFVILFPSFTFAQNERIQDALEKKLATLRFLTALQNPTGGFEGGPKDSKASLRSTSAAVRALKYLTGKKTSEAVPNVKDCAAFVMSCYDPKTGGFADAPGGKSDVALTAVGVMAAVELEVPKEKFAKAMDYLKENARTFEDVRIGAAAVEAWGVKDCPFKLDDWYQMAKRSAGLADPDLAIDGGARDLASAVAMILRLDFPLTVNPSHATAISVLQEGQREPTNVDGKKLKPAEADGGWGKAGAKASDLETTYRVMRALHLLKAKPDHPPKLREFIAKCRNKDGGYGLKPGEPSTAGGVYFAAIVSKWLDEMEKK